MTPRHDSIDDKIKNADCLDHEDDFDSFLHDKLNDPRFAAAYEDAAQRARLVQDLVGCRKAQNLKQWQIAQHMDVGQSTVSEFENATSDAYFSTLQRYARAIGARLKVRIEMPADQTWAGHVRANYAHCSLGVSDPASTEVKRPDGVWLNNWAHEVRRAHEPEAASV